jgi:N-glycosidase YbiA
MKEIKFYRVNEPYGFFSNFSPHPIFVDDEVWMTVEHYFQASKFEDNEIKSRIKALDSPMKAADEGRSTRNKIRDDWDEIKEEIMLDALMAKFLQHPRLRVELLNTGASVIIENTANDRYWGDGGDGTGKNRLGILLMDVREKIKKYSEDTNTILPPWIAFPSVSQYDTFWRMGLGEEYLIQWSKYFLSSNRSAYMEKFPEVAEWTGIYE